MPNVYPQSVDGGKTTISGLSDHMLKTQDGDLRNRTTEQDTNLPDDVQYAEIGARLERIRKEMSDLSQRAWAERHGFNPTQYNNWAKGSRRIPVEAAEKLCEAYGLTLDFIYRGRRDGLPSNLRNKV